MAQNGPSNEEYQRSAQPNPALTVTTMMNGSTSPMTAPDVEESSTMDHALLESLFYNEMMMLSGSSSSSSNFLSQHFNEATHPKCQSDSVTPPPGSDPNTIAEKEMLRDFGVSASPAHKISDHTTIVATPDGFSTTDLTHMWSTDPVHAQHAVIAPPTPAVGQAPGLIPIYPAAPMFSASQPLAPALPLHAAENVSTYDSRISPNAPALSIEVPAGKPAVSQDRAKQLVDQFATLASRLGIELPTTVLQSLTTAAAQNDPEAQAAGLAYAAATAKPSQALSSAAFLSAEAQNQDSSSDDMDESVTPTLKEVRKTAEDSIATATKRRASDMNAPEAAALATSNSKDTKHSKRRKKPRLADCESRLAQLKAENELLKRHLQNVSNKAHRLDQEKEAAGKRIHGLLEENAGNDEMNVAVREFSDMYSDYGKNREQELSFHLEQLQRLANPTNFTKMGLWTLGQNAISPKRNPIAGILQKELDITSQQGKKILDQSEKIRALCDNLKECLALLAKLKALCEQKTNLFHNRMDKCTEILTSKQVVKLIKWIDDHTELLETVCPGWGTEHIHSSSSKHK